MDDSKRREKEEKEVEEITEAMMCLSTSERGDQRKKGKS
jgi:hypothetical protein